MPLLYFFVGSLTLGGALIGIALWIASRNPDSKMATMLSDILTKSGIVVFGGLVAFIAFFGQKWFEDINSNIDGANEALANIDYLKSQYMNNVESMYYNNDKTFEDLYDRCRQADPRFTDNSKSNKYCEKDAESSKVGVDVISDGAYYFDFNPQEDYFGDFVEKLYEQTFLKKTSITDIIGKIIWTHSAIVDDYADILDEIKTIKAEYEKVRVEFSKIENEKSRRSRNVNIFAHTLCCAVGQIWQDSEEIRKFATVQAGQFCAIQTEIPNILTRTLDLSVKWVASKRLEEISERAKAATTPTAPEVTASLAVTGTQPPANQCEFTPKDDSDQP